MDYLILDTNIYISMCLKRYDSVTEDSLSHIRGLLDTNVIKVIVPSVVRNEFKRRIRIEFDRSSKFVKSTIDSIDKAVLPLEIKGNNYSWEKINRLKSAIIKNLRSINEKIDKMDLDHQIKPIMELMQHQNVLLLEAEDHVIINTYKRIINKKAPAHRQEKSGDCMIVEIIIDQFSKNPADGKIWFISADRGDFTDPEDKKGERLHPDLVEDFEKLGIEYSPYLGKVLKEHYAIDIPPDDIEYEKERVDETYYPWVVDFSTGFAVQPSTGKIRPYPIGFLGMTHRHSSYLTATGEEATAFALDLESGVARPFSYSDLGESSTPFTVMGSGGRSQYPDFDDEG